MKLGELGRGTNVAADYPMKIDSGQKSSRAATKLQKRNVRTSRMLESKLHFEHSLSSVHPLKRFS